MTRTLVDCPAPAKVNLFLHVTGRRDDGYHFLQTAFMLVDRADMLDFKVRDDGQVIRTTDLPGVPADQDLVVRAARLLQQATGCQLGAEITVRKHLPMGGGLGGGSSDAATTLMALNHLWDCGLTREQLMQLGVRLGADVPFFIFGENAFAEGIGEQLQPFTAPQGWLVVIEPGVSVPTAQIFSDKQLTRDTKPVRITDFPADNDFYKSGFGKNDLEPVATRLFPPVAQALDWLGQFGNARMSGSGASVFCLFDNFEKTVKITRLAPTDWKVWTAKTMQQHPLYEIIRSV